MPFRTLLSDYVRRHCHGVRGAILCDHEGERIDAACDADVGTFELDVVGASFATWLSRVTHTFAVDVHVRVVVREYIVWIAPLSEGCYLLVLCARGRDARVSSSIGALAAALRVHL